MIIKITYWLILLFVFILKGFVADKPYLLLMLLIL